MYYYMTCVYCKIKNLTDFANDEKKVTHKKYIIIEYVTIK